MECENVSNILYQIEQAKGGPVDFNASDSETLQELLTAGYVTKSTARDARIEETNSLKQQLANLQAREKEITAEIRQLKGGRLPSPRKAANKTEIGELERELASIDDSQKQIRTQILDLSANAASIAGSAQVGGENYTVTFLGRELLTMLLPRLPRCRGMSIADFQKELDQVKFIFSQQAKQAAAILKKISPKFRKIDEIHLRASAVGLALRLESADQVANGFVLAMQQLDRAHIPEEERVLAAECLVFNAPDLLLHSINASVGDYVSLYHQAQKYAKTDQDALNCALILLPLHYLPETRERALQEAQEFAREHIDQGNDKESHIAPALMVATEGTVYDATITEQFNGFFHTVLSLTNSVQDAAYAAAVFTVSKGDSAELLNKFTVAKDYFGRFTDTPLVVPAAMLSLMATEIAETIDTLRIAAAVVSQNKLALGSVENLSLGAKLLVQSAVALRASYAPEAPALAPEVPTPGQEVPTPAEYYTPPLNVPQVGYVPPPLLFMPYYPFYPMYPYYPFFTFWGLHRWSFHRAAMWNYRFHPVHAHYMYG
ncbi:MAG TPA: hypothetical protein VKK79_16990 [Candidatus Lokiarchaeia archaeon]|nr:hypothetical protein [Candidatus Lokiarchaeia archaeon]